MMLQSNEIVSIISLLYRLVYRLIKYDKDGYARIGVMPRYGDANSVRWFDVQPSCVFHLINCFEDNDEVVSVLFITKFTSI